MYNIVLRDSTHEHRAAGQIWGISTHVDHVRPQPCDSIDSSDQIPGGRTGSDKRCARPAARYALLRLRKLGPPSRGRRVTGWRSRSSPGEDSYDSVWSSESRARSTSDKLVELKGGSLAAATGDAVSRRLAPLIFSSCLPARPQRERFSHFGQPPSRDGPCPAVRNSGFR